MRRLFTAILLLFCLVASCIFIVQPVRANSIIVVPDDYPTITSAIDKALDGDTILVRAGTYEGPINQTILINKTLTIVGQNTISTIIKLHPAYNVSWILTSSFVSCSDALIITDDDCRLLNLTLEISYGGAVSITGNRTQIAGNKITSDILIQGAYCRITDNNILMTIGLNGNFNEASRNSAGAFSIEGASNLIKDNSCQSIHLGNSTNNIVLGNTVTHGINLMWSENNFLYRNHVSDTWGYGFRFWFSSENTIAANTIHNTLDAGVAMGGSYDNRFYLNNFIDKILGFAPDVYDFYTDGNYRSSFPDMMLSANFWDNSTSGNYWESYNASDVNSDGIADVPYIINGKNQDNFPLLTQVDTDNIIFELPEWAYPSPDTSTSPIPFPSFSPTPTPSPSPSPTPTSTMTPTQTPTPTATPIPTLSPSPSIPEFPSWIILTALLIAVTLVIAAIKRKIH